MLLLVFVILGSINGLFNVGNASLFNCTLNFSLHFIRSKNCGDCPGSKASSGKRSEHILVFDDGLNAFRLQNSIQAFFLYCWFDNLPLGNRKKNALLSSFCCHCYNRRLGNTYFIIYCRITPSNKRKHNRRSSRLF